MKAAVVGAAGRMGSWFTGYFAEKGFETAAYDVRLEEARKVAERYGARCVADASEAVQEADIVLVSVPIDVTPEVIAELSEAAKPGCVIAEITSFKRNIVQHMVAAGRRGAVPLSIHPMFGPGAKGLSGQRLIVTPVVNMKRELLMAKKFFPDADIVSATVEEHDSAMAVVLSLTHLVNFAFTSTLSALDLKRLRRLAGTSFTLQLILAQAILHDDAEFLAYLQTENRYAAEHVAKFVREVEELGEIVAARDGEKLTSKLRRLKEEAERDRAYPQSYRKMYEVIDRFLEE